MTEDVLDRLAAYRPTDRDLAEAWPAAERAALRARLLADPGAGAARRLLYRARPSRRVGLAISTLALAGVAAAVVVATLSPAERSTRSGKTQPGAAPTPSTPTAPPHPGIGAHQYSYRVLQAYAVRDGRRAGSIARTWAWVSADGTTWERHAERGQVTCYRYDHVGQPNFGNATQSFFNSLPTEPRALTRYMRSHVSGSRSTDEAVFVAVGDALRERDGLASPALRAAFVAVLRRTPHVTVRTGEHDALGRPATQASFDEGGGVVTSLYFEPSTGELLEEGVSSGAHGPGNVDVATHESVVDQLPAAIARCPSGGN